MGQGDAPPNRSRPPYRATLEQRIAHTAVEVSHAVIRAEDYSEYLTNQAHVLFGADAGVGLATWRTYTSAAAD